MRAEQLKARYVGAMLSLDAKSVMLAAGIAIIVCVWTTCWIVLSILIHLLDNLGDDCKSQAEFLIACSIRSSQSNLQDANDSSTT